MQPESSTYRSKYHANVVHNQGDGGVVHIHSNSSPVVSGIHASHSSVDFGIFAPLQVERLAIVHMMTEPKQLQKNDHFFVQGKIGQCNVVVYSLDNSEYGSSPASSVVEAMITGFSVKYVISMGIAGGLPDPSQPTKDIRLGDVVVATGGIWKYDVGKLIGEQFTPILTDKDASMYLAASFNRFFEGSECLDLWIEKLQSSSSAMEKRYLQFPQFKWSRPEVDVLEMNGRQISRQERRIPLAFPGKSVCADHLLKSDTRRQVLVEMNKDYLSFEMESYGVEISCRRHGLPWLAFRGICDYCDENKNKHWQPYAALSCASLICVWLTTSQFKHVDCQPLTILNRQVDVQSHHVDEIRPQKWPSYGQKNIGNVVVYEFATIQHIDTINYAILNEKRVVIERASRSDLCQNVLRRRTYEVTPVRFTDNGKKIYVKEKKTVKLDSIISVNLLNSILGASKSDAGVYYSKTGDSGPMIQEHKLAELEINRSDQSTTTSTSTTKL